MATHASAPALRQADASGAGRPTALETATGRRLGQPDDPLLVSVRSGARFSMPDMMERSSTSD